MRPEERGLARVTECTGDQHSAAITLDWLLFSRYIVSASLQPRGLYFLSPARFARRPPPTSRQPRANLRPAEFWRRCISGASSLPGPGSPARSPPAAAPAGFRAGVVLADPWRPCRDPTIPVTSPLCLGKLIMALSIMDNVSNG